MAKNTYSKSDRAAYMRMYRQRKIGKLHAKKDSLEQTYLKNPTEENLLNVREILAEIAICNTKRKVCHLGTVKYCVQ